MVGLIGGPPCETWSQARGRALEPGVRGPRAVRDSSTPWAKPSLSLRELRQVTLGNVLMGFELEALANLACTGGVGALEHPAPPSNEDAPTIWRTSIMKVLLSLPGSQIIQMAQGLWGAPSPKPTSLFLLSAPGMQAELRRWQVTTDLPRAISIGKAADRAWATAKLKEYPPAMSGGLAAGFLSALSALPLAREVEVPASFQATIQPMLQTDFSSFYGPDYAGV